MEGGAVAEGTPKTGVYKTTLLRPGHLYFFKVRSAAGWWAESGDSNIASFMWDIPPASPQKLDAKILDGKVMLTWSPVTTHMDGTEIKEMVKYQVLRDSGSGVFSPTGDLQNGLEFIDNQVVNGRKYKYKVQAVTMYNKGHVGGGASPVIEAIPVDQSPPPEPSGIQGVRTANGVRIVWGSVQSPDLKGYRIYRRLTKGSKAVRIGEVDASATIFNDPEPPESDQWFYSVTSFDRSRPENESKPSAEVEVRN